MQVSKKRVVLRGFAAGTPPPFLSPEDLADVLGESVRQGLLGLLGAHLREQGAVPAPLPPELEPRVGYTLVAHGLRRLELARRVLLRLEAAGLRALPLKGAAVAELLYRSAAERPMADVDILVLDDWSRAVVALEAEGFREVARADHAVAFVGPGSDIPLELHHSPTSCPGLFPLEAEGLWERRRAGAGLVPWRPSDEDLLLTSALHAAFQHGLVLSLVQWLDLRRLVERPLDTAALLARAERAGALACLAAALEVARLVVEAPLPAALREALVPHLPARLRRRLAEGKPLDFVSPARADVAGVRFALLRGRRLELVRRTVFGTTPGTVRSRPAALLAGAARTLGLARRWAWPAGLAALGHSGSGHDG